MRGSVKFVIWKFLNKYPIKIRKEMYEMQILTRPILLIIFFEVLTLISPRTGMN